MPQYLLSLHIRTDAVPERSAAEQQALMQRIADLESEMRADGVLVSQGALTAAHTARVVDASGDATTITDGPFTETKEHLGGFYVIEAADEKTALQWAAKTSACIGQPIEVRAFFDRRDG